MKEDHMMMLATRLYNDDAYEAYETISLALLHCIASLPLAQVIIDYALPIIRPIHVLHNPTRPPG